MARDSFKTDFKRNFLAGFAALFPIVLTIVVLLWLYGKVESIVGVRVNKAAAVYLASKPQLFKKVFTDAPAETAADAKLRRQYAQDNMPKLLGAIVGIIIILIFMYLTGTILRGYIGGRIIRFVDGFFERFPVIKTIYPHARQLTNIFFAGEQRKRFGRVVAVQYPRPGIYSLGFVTGDAFKEILDRTKMDLVTVFIPTSPTPITGFITFVRKEELIDINITVDQAFRLFITAGFVAPGMEKKKVVETVIVPGARLVEGQKVEGDEQQNKQD